MNSAPMVLQMVIHKCVLEGEENVEERKKSVLISRNLELISKDHIVLDFGRKGIWVFTTSTSYYVCWCRLGRQQEITWIQKTCV
jgi:hypothetical protein